MLSRLSYARKQDIGFRVVFGVCHGDEGARSIQGIPKELLTSEPLEMFKY